MPLFKTITNRNNTTVYVWHVTESEKDLAHGYSLSQNSINRLSQMKSELHRRAFLSIRHLLKLAGYSDHDLSYDALGKPHLIDHNYISITHSYTFTAIVVSEQPTGIDIEKQRDKITRIARKFIGYENDYLNIEKQYVKMLTIIWGAKESMYKCYGKKGLGFKAHCQVASFSINEKHTTASLHFENDVLHYDAFYEDLGGFTLVYILPQ